jgi:hypothetical protein
MAQQRRDKEHSWMGVVVLAVLVLLGLALVLADAPPAPLGEGVPATQFSAERAFHDLEAIAQRPHPVGSPEHAVVENYILSALRQIGLTPEVQQATEKDKWMEMPFHLENIAAVLKGSASGKSVLLVAHYDSVSAGPGASDDGAAVATLLETARMLKAQAPFKRDIVFLFTDGEELGLLGAKAFVEENPLAKNIGLVLNFEARGTGGQVILFETSDQNSWLIDNVSKAASHPVANSLSYEIYKRLPNDTDLTVFKHAGFPGLNFAFIQNVRYYHTAGDNLQHLDHGSLQQQGDYAVELARWFGNVDHLEAGRGNEVYFDLLGRLLVHYSTRTALILLIAAAILLAWVFFPGFQQNRLSLGRLALSLVLAIIGVAVSLAGTFVIQAVSRVLSARFARVHTSMGDHPGYYVAAAVAFGLTLASIVFTWASRRFGAADVGAAAMLIWLGLATWTTFWLPGMSYLWVWPLIFNALASVLALAADKKQGSMLLLAGIIPAVVIMVPLAHKVYAAFGLGSGLIVSALFALVLFLGAVQLGPDSMPRPSLLPISLGCAGTILLGTALFL